jgi:hypothetical protein
MAGPTRSYVAALSSKAFSMFCLVATVNSGISLSSFWHGRSLLGLRYLSIF